MSGAHGHGHGHAHGDSHAHGHGQIAGRAAIASVSVALFLLAIKSYATWVTGSVSMLGSLADTGLDVIASLVTLLGVRWAAQPADAEHRFGHGKAEALAAMVQVILIAVSGIGIAVRAIQRLVNGELTAAPEFGIGVSVIAILVTVFLLAYQRAVIRRTGSVAIRADHVHYQSDLLLNGAVIAAIGLDGYLGLSWADPVFGIGIGAWLLYGAWRAAAHAMDQLMDREWPAEKRRAFVEVAARHPELKTLHDLRTRTSGARDFVQFHVEMDGAMTVRDAHDVLDRVESSLAAEFPGIEILIHIDPEGQVDRPHDAMAEDNLLAHVECRPAGDAA